MAEEAGFLDGARVEHLRALGGGEFVDRLIEIFLRNAPARIAAARAALEIGDRQEAGRAVHSLAGSAGNLGAGGLHRICREVERRLAREALETILPLLEEMEEGLGRLRVRLESIRKGSAA